MSQPKVVDLGYLDDLANHYHVVAIGHPDWDGRTCITVIVEGYPWMTIDWLYEDGKDTPRVRTVEPTTDYAAETFVNVLTILGELSDEAPQGFHYIWNDQDSVNLWPRAFDITCERFMVDEGHPTQAFADKVLEKFYGTSTPTDPYSGMS